MPDYKRVQKLFLASSSQGRQELLRDAGFSFELLPQNFDEDSVKASGMSAQELVNKITIGKLGSIKFAAIDHEPCAFVITSDTMVETMDTHQILGKPKDIQDAKRMLELLRQESAMVYSGVAIARLEHGIEVARKVCTVSTEIKFFLPKEREEEYITNKPNILNVCSGASVQGFGAQFVECVNGSYSNVIGLPMFELCEKLQELGWQF